eukprot:CAMPEP_0201920654 /NCGR_PEP_ID=MMETSP0903-20130614/9214_1 /ASSEMBLY_ACC=CAM_ASM_000552 /TAXON_ID=420261 /ORGANISM="Thalassiosira antarctica, Strain CCMP982" /LENGTH=525 /DNA_ID=CAMNT_0048457451 /DNA_START=98 /DNA_END=1671 /DNA_ORIENTATION=+
MDSKQGEEADENTYTGSPSPPSVAGVAYQMPEGGSHQGDVSPQPNWSHSSHQPSWSQPFINQDSQNTMYQQQMQHANYQNWQMPAYGDFAPRFGAPYPPHASNSMYPPGHQFNIMGYQQHPSWHSSSAGSSGSLRSLRSLGRGDNRKKSSKRRGQEKKQPVASIEVHCDAGMTLHQIEGRVVKIAKDQDGSRIIQQRLAIANDSEIQMVFDEAMLGIEELWNDVYGNFILQKLLELGTDDMKAIIGKRLHSDTASLSRMVYGCRVIQKAFGELSKKDVANLISTLKGNVLFCLHNRNGNHVIQKSITILSSMAKEARENGDDDLCSFFLGSLDPIIDEIVRSIEDLSRHSYGCRAVQRILEHCVEPQKTKILDSIIACQQKLLKDQYGNYVVQKVLTCGRQSDRDAIFESITVNNSVIKFSKQKQASNVVEAMLRLGDANQRQKIVQQMLDCFCVDQHDETESAAVSMSKNAYANYVVKTALEVLEEGRQRDQLYSELLSNLAELEVVPFAKHIVAKVKTYQPNP